MPKSYSYKDKRLCPGCDYLADKSEWSHLEVSSSSGHSGIFCREYDIDKKQSKHIGSVHLLSCPRCKTIIWER